MRSHKNHQTPVKCAFLIIIIIIDILYHTASYHIVYTKSAQHMDHRPHAACMKSQDAARSNPRKMC